MRRKKKRELSTRARQSGPFSALSRLYDLLTQSVVLIIIFIALAYFINNLVVNHFISEDEVLKISKVRLLPENDKDVQELLSHVNAKSGDVYNDQNSNSLRISLLVFQWIDDVHFDYSDNGILSVTIDRKVPICKLKLGKDEGLSQTAVISLVDRNLDVFDPSGDVYLDGLKHLPVLTFYSEDSRPLDLPQFKSGVDFIDIFSGGFSPGAGQSGQKFAIETITYSKDSWYIVLHGDKVIHILDSNPVSYIPYIQRALARHDILMSLDRYSLHFDNHFTAVLRPKSEPIIDFARL